MSAFDVLVIGGGPGGYVAAIRAAQLGLKTALVEREVALGGTCLRVGCIPSKALLESSRLFREAGHGLAAHGIGMSGPRLDLAAMLRRKDTVVATLAKGIDGLLRKNGIVRIAGHGRITGPGTVEVTGPDGVLAFSAGKIVIATGSKVSLLPGVELGGSVCTSTEALSFDTVPGHLVVVGAGYIGLELGSVWSRLGAKVTVVEYLDRILPGMDLEIAEEARKIFQGQGIEFRLGHKVQSVKDESGRALVRCEGRDPIDADRALVADGRVPNTDGLGLDAVGIRTEKGRVVVDDHFRTSAQGFFAIGDVVRGPMLAHKAEEEGVAVAEVMAGRRGHVNYDVIPGVCYTHPEIASVGRTEEQLVGAGIPFRKGVFPFRANGRALAVAESEGRVKVLAHATTDRILGVHIIGAHAGEIVAEAVAAMSFHASAEDVALTSHAHPTMAEAFKEACLAVHGRALHS